MQYIRIEVQYIRIEVQYIQIFAQLGHRQQITELYKFNHLLPKISVYSSKNTLIVGNIFTLNINIYMINIEMINHTQI